MTDEERIGWRQLEDGTWEEVGEDGFPDRPVDGQTLPHVMAERSRNRLRAVPDSSTEDAPSS